MQETAERLESVKVKASVKARLDDEQAKQRQATGSKPSMSELIENLMDSKSGEAALQLQVERDQNQRLRNLLKQIETLAGKASAQFL